MPRTQPATHASEVERPRINRAIDGKFKFKMSDNDDEEAEAIENKQVFTDI